MPEGEQLTRPLSGIRVVDLSSSLAGPYLGMCLGDMGADIIKVENPLGGDMTRQWSPPEIGGEAAYFLSANRNKRSVALDLRAAQGQRLLRQMVRSRTSSSTIFGPIVPCTKSFPTTSSVPTTSG